MTNSRSPEAAGSQATDSQAALGLGLVWLLPTSAPEEQH
jgi:hypothetical protein